MNATFLLILHSFLSYYYLFFPSCMRTPKGPHWLYICHLYPSLASLGPLAWEVIWRKDSFSSIVHLKYFCECHLSSSKRVDCEWDRWTFGDLVVNLAIGWSQCQFNCLTTFPWCWPVHLRNLDWEFIKCRWGLRRCLCLNCVVNLTPWLTFSSTRKKHVFVAEIREVKMEVRT